jgi:hypothetical protein
MSINFLGIDKEHWDFLNSFANWVSAVGTVSAVVVSLWISLRQGRVALAVDAGTMDYTQSIEGQQISTSSYVAVRVFNEGQAPAQVTGIGWAYGERRRWQRCTFAEVPFIAGEGWTGNLPAILFLANRRNGGLTGSVGWRKPTGTIRSTGGIQCRRSRLRSLRPAGVSFEDLCVSR